MTRDEFFKRFPHAIDFIPVEHPQCRFCGHQWQWNISKKRLKLIEYHTIYCKFIDNDELVHDLEGLERVGNIPKNAPRAERDIRH